MIAELIKKNRSYRRYQEDVNISGDEVRGLIDLARLSASAANLQPLKYIVSNTPESNGRIFSCLAWAAYLKDWSGPKEGERPSAYIVMLGDTELNKNFHCDSGIAAQSILLGAAEKGLGGCIIASVKRDRLRELLSIPERYEILMVIALGMPKEEVVIEDLPKDGDVKYWRDANMVHHVPKRGLDDIILKVV